jgi:hypothetical protein
MACEYLSDKDIKWCDLTRKACLVDVDVDKTAYRHCLRREWKTRLDARHATILQRPCSSLDDIYNSDLVDSLDNIAPKCPGLPL